MDASFVLLSTVWGNQGRRQRYHGQNTDRDTRNSRTNLETVLPFTLFLFLLACLPSLIGWLGKVVLGRTERVPSRFEMDVSIVQYGWSMSFLSPSSFYPFSSCTSCKAKAGKNKIKIKIMVHRIFPSSLPLPLPRDRNSDTGHPSPKQISVWRCPLYPFLTLYSPNLL